MAMRYKDDGVIAFENKLAALLRFSPYWEVVMAVYGIERDF